MSSFLLNLSFRTYLCVQWTCGSWLHQKVRIWIQNRLAKHHRNIYYFIWNILTLMSNINTFLWKNCIFVTIASISFSKHDITLPSYCLTFDTDCWQSFVVAILALVVATFSTGIDSKCFQVSYRIYIEFYFNSRFSPKHI